MSDEETQGDDTIAVLSKEGTLFSLSRSILRNRSEYFRCLLSSGMRECNENSVSLPVLSTASLNSVVKFITEGSCTLDLDGCWEVLSAASYLQIPDLVIYCCDYLIGQINSSNCFYMLSKADELMLDDFQPTVLSFVYNNFTQVSKSRDFLNADVGTICDLLSSDAIIVQEEIIFDAIIRWLTFDKQRLPAAASLFNCVRFPLIAKNKLNRCIKVLKTKGYYDICKEYIDESQYIHENITAIHCSRVGRKGRIRGPIKLLVGAGGFTKKESCSNRLQFLNVGSMSEAPELRFFSARNTRLPYTMCEHCVCVLDGCLYIAGGQIEYSDDGRFTSNSVLRYNPRFSTWDQVCSMQTPRSLFYMGEINRNFYAVGGWQAPDTVTSTVEKYTPEEDRWEYVTSLEMGLHEHTGCVHEGSIYISGGYKGALKGHIDKVWKFDPVTEQWENRSPMTYPRSYHVMVSCLGKLLVAGGVNYLNEEKFHDVLECEQYCPATDQWTTVTKLPRFASCMPHLLHQNKLHLFGGHSFVKVRCHFNVQILNIEDMTWTEKEFTSNKILFFAATVIDLPQTFTKKYIKFR